MLTLLRKTLLKKRKDYFWIAKCSCGKEILIEKYKVISGNTKSCGCEKIERVRLMGLRNKKHGRYCQPQMNPGDGIHERASMASVPNADINRVPNWEDKVRSFFGGKK